jgi:hypothetical protein
MMFKIITFFMITLFVGLYVRVGILYVFVLISFFFWLLYCLSFVLWSPITPLVYSYISLYKSSKQMILGFFSK